MARPVIPRRRAVLLARSAFRVAVAVLALFCGAPSGCSGGGDGGAGSSTGNPASSPAAAPDPTKTGTSLNLTENNVNTIVLQATNEANARGRPATIAVVDRVGNVLTVAQMPGAPTSATITSGRSVAAGLENQPLATTLAAIRMTRW